jgi:uncharacterized protein
MTAAHEAPDVPVETDAPASSGSLAEPAAAEVRGVPDVLAPVDAGERLQALDVVRGFALFGIFLMNVEFFTRPMQDIGAAGIDPAQSGLDWWADAAIFFLVQSKFWTLFSLLFGMGFALMIERARRAGRPFVPAYLRRSLALMAIGAAHAILVWAGDILLTYAVGALLLLAFRGLRRLFKRDAPPLSAGVLAGLGASLYGLMLGLMLFGGMVMSSLPQDEAMQAAQAGAHADAMAELTLMREQAVEAYSQGTYGEAVAQRVADTLEQIGSWGFFLPLLLGVFMIGAAILRSGIAEDPRAHAGKLRLARNVGLPVGFALMALSTSLGTGMMFDSFGVREAVQAASYLAAGLVLALAYGATVVLALQGAAGDWMRAWLAPAGRMALTNYLVQSVVGTLVFYGYGLGLWGQVERFGQVLLVLGVFALQLVLSRWWLARFRFGPAEWVWRALTYWTRPPMRREQAA